LELRQRAAGGQILTQLYRLANFRGIALATAAYAAFLILVMAPQAEVMQQTAGEWGAPDGHFVYTPDEMYRHLSEWGDEARAAYTKFRLTLDPLWALVYGSFLLTITGTALRRCVATDSSWRKLILLPLLPMSADIAENFFGIALVAALPERIEWLAWLMAATTSFKWLTLALAHVVMVAVIAAALARAWRSR
jgi:hypothetical protein